MKRTDADYLTSIRDGIDRIERRTAQGRGAVLADDVLFDSVLQRLETLSGAVSRLSDPL